MPYDDYFKEVRELLKELAESQKLTDKKLAESREDIDKELREIRRDIQKEIEQTQKEIRDTQKELRESQKSVERSVETLKGEVTKIVGGWGMFVEGLVAPGVPKLLKKCDIDIKSTHLNVENRLNGRRMEIDVMGVGTRNGKGIVVACSIKSRLQASDVQEFIERLDSFFDFFPEYADRELIGLVGGIRIDGGVEKYAERQGFYVIGSSGDVVKLLNKKDFKPKIWK
ncbi:MAG: hypothetical protein AB1567_12915 [bacterium]